MNRWYVSASIEILGGIICVALTLLRPNPVGFLLAGLCFGMGITMILNGINEYDL